jgi:hypothetical protein
MIRTFKLILRLDLMGLDEGQRHIGQNLASANLDFTPKDDSIGVIYGNLSSTQFRFAITGSRVKRTGYVQVWHDDHGWVPNHGTQS